jgi:predicted transposase/invertase (TIGR01784 family)
MQFLRSERREEFEMAASTNPEIRKAVDNLYELSADEKVRAEYAMRQKAWRDRISQNDGYYQEGIQQGGQDRARQIAKRMKARGRSPEEIAEDTGLDPDTVKRL